jgi:FMN phosphatase YigB (HAD superfamily)
VHVANSWYADVVPCNRQGITCIWANRDRDDNDPTVATEVKPDLTDLVELVERLVPG